jgi:hypothetical protein
MAIDFRRYQERIAQHVCGGGDLMDFKKPRIALWYYIVPQTGYRNDGACLFVNYNLRKILDGQDALKDNKVMSTDHGNVVHIQPNEPTKLLGNFDLHVLIDHGEDGIQAPLDFVVPKPNLYWIADSHLGFDYRLKRAKEFDRVWVSHKPSIQKFIDGGIDPAKISYMPWAAEDQCYKPYPIIEKWDWCFIGHLNNPFRIALVDRFCKEWRVGEQGYLGWRMAEIPGHNVLEDVAKKFSQSRIVLNESILDDLNMRTFETLACKRLLLCEDVPGVRDHFENGKHLVLFKTIDEAVAKAKELLADTPRREAIAEAGYREFLAKHTYMHRSKEILKQCLNYEPKEELVCP